MCSVFKPKGYLHLHAKIDNLVILCRTTQLSNHMQDNERKDVSSLHNKVENHVTFTNAANPRSQQINRDAGLL